MSWDILIDEAALASVLPGDAARFARPVRDGLIVFLSGLPESHQAEILAEQFSLPPDASISMRLGLLARQCPVLHKLGQILARDARLAPALQIQLQTLESLPASVPQSQIEAALQGELGSLEKRGIRLAPAALAEASVAVVIPFEYQQGTASAAGREGVFKLLKPGIIERLEQELDLLEQVGIHLDERCADLQIPPLNYQESFQQVKDKLRWEIRLDEEQRHLARARTNYGSDHRIQIPALLDFCTSRVTAMERVRGEKVTEPARRDPHIRPWLAELIVEALIAQPIFSRARRALFHSDPHAGNLLATTDGRLAILDWSLVGELGERERVAIVQILLGAATMHAERIVAVLESLADPGRLQLPVLRRVVATALRRLRQGQFPGFQWLVAMLDDAVMNAGLRVPADLLMFRKTLHTLEGVVGCLGLSGNAVDELLVRTFFRHFAHEWPQRWFALPNSRNFATRLSNADLTRTIWSLPWTATRFWAEQTLDLVRMFQATDRRNMESRHC